MEKLLFEYSLCCFWTIATNLPSGLGPIVVSITEAFQGWADMSVGYYVCACVRVWRVVLVNWKIEIPVIFDVFLVLIFLTAHK